MAEEFQSFNNARFGQSRATAMKRSGRPSSLAVRIIFSASCIIENGKRCFQSLVNIKSLDSRSYINFTLCVVAGNININSNDIKSCLKLALNSLRSRHLNFCSCILAYLLTEHRGSVFLLKSQRKFLLRNVHTRACNVHAPVCRIRDHKDIARFTEAREVDRCAGYGLLRSPRG